MSVSGYLSNDFIVSTRKKPLRSIGAGIRRHKRIVAFNQKRQEFQARQGAFDELRARRAAERQAG